MGAPLTIEQMILNHNIGVNMSDAGTLSGHPVTDFSLVGHEHSADDITSGILNPDRLPIATTTAAGIVSLTNSIDSDSHQLAASGYALGAVYRMAAGKANLGHKHAADEITEGMFAGPVQARSNTLYGVKQVRNIILSKNTPKSSDGSNGDIWLQYEP